jgi:acyl carrier protein
MGDTGTQRAQQVLERLRALTAELSGYDAKDLVDTSSFLELGFDSLFLTQLAGAYQNAYGLKITFRQLFDELPSLRALANHIDANLPLEARAVETAPASPPPVAAPIGESNLAATAAAPPPLEPPGVRERSHGLRQTPFNAESVIGVSPSSGVFVFPITTNPAARSRATTAASKSGTQSANAREESVVRIPAVGFRSLTGIGTPENGPGRGEPASARACS